MTSSITDQVDSSQEYSFSNNNKINVLFEDIWNQYSSNDTSEYVDIKVKYFYGGMIIVIALFAIILYIVARIKDKKC